MERAKATEVDAAEERPDRPVSIDSAVAALLDHIAEDLAREYVRLMEHVAQEGGSGHPREPDDWEA